MHGTTPRGTNSPSLPQPTPHQRRPGSRRHAMAAALGLLVATSAALSQGSSALVVEVDRAQDVGAIRDVFGVNRRPGFADRSGGTSMNAANLYAAFGVSQVRLHDAGLDLCPTYTAASKLNTGTTPVQEVQGCELSGTGSIPVFTWTPLSSADADLNLSSNYDFSNADTALNETAATGAAVYLRLGESYNGPNNTGDPVAWSKVATNIYRHVIGQFKPTPGVAAVDPVFVEVHNEPDGGFWRGTAADFYTLFRETVTRVRAAAGATGRSVHIGGPGFTRSILTSSQVAGNPANGFIAGVGRENLDFYSAHLYSTCATATLASTATFLRSLRALVDGQGGTGLPLHITEWNIGLGNQCGNALYGEARMQSFASGVLTQMQDPAHAIEAAHFYAGVPIMGLFDFTSVSGKARVNPSAWAFWAHSRLRGATQTALQVCQGATCASGTAAETMPLLGLAARQGDATTVVLTNDGTNAQATTLRLRNVGSARLDATLLTPPPTAQDLPTAGNPLQADAAALQSLLAQPTRETRSGLQPQNGTLELTVTVPARGLLVVQLAPPPTLTSQADCLFDWGERHYPTYLQPAPQLSQTLGDYYYRAYPGSRTYLGISLTGSRLLFLDDRGGGIQDLGALDGWLATAGCN